MRAWDSHVKENRILSKKILTLPFPGVSLQNPEKGNFLAIFGKFLSEHFWYASLQPLAGPKGNLKKFLFTNYLPYLQCTDPPLLLSEIWLCHGFGLLRLSKLRIDTT